MGKGREEPIESAENIFDFYAYETMENDDPYVGSQDTFVAGDLFVSMTKDWDSFSDHADMNILPLLIYGPKGFGKTSLSHTLASKAKINLFEYDFASKWQEEVNLEKSKMDTKAFEKMLNTASIYLTNHPESRLILLLKGFDPNINLFNFFENPSIQALLDRLFIIVNIDIDESRESKNTISKFEHFFDIHVSRFDESTHFSVLNKLIDSKFHDLSEKEVQKLAQKTRYYTGDELNQLLRLASKNSLYRTRIPKSQIAYEDFECALAHDLFSQRHNPSHAMMYL
ncbi:MAG: AAA family ATPase [Oligoflexales bacterium]